MKTRAKEREVTWCGKITTCDVCQGDFHGTMFDASLRSFECWANVCSGCFARYGYGLGEGLGQEYCYRQNDDKWVKVPIDTGI